MNRISEIDLLRGVALLGIFLMNIVAMALPLEAYSNPYAFDAQTWWSSDVNTLYGRDWLNTVVFSANHIFIDQKMMSLFSLLFGASTMLFLSKLKEKQQGIKFYFYRNTWLIVFGILHAVFIFFGDVLSVYGFCALFLVLFSRLRASIQFSLGILIYCIPIVMQTSMYFSIAGFSVDQLSDLDEIWFPSVDIVQNYINYYLQVPYVEQVLTTLGYYDQGVEDINEMSTWYWDALIIEGFARAFGMMLIGMSFFSQGVLPNSLSLQKDIDRENELYLNMQRIGFGLGIPIICFGLYLNYSYSWQAPFSSIGGRLLNMIGTPFVVCAYIGTIILWSRQRHKSHFSQSLQLKLQAVGRMAFTNYIMQSVVGLLLFTGVVFSLFAKLNRLELLAIVLLTWLIQMYFSEWWMKRFRYGPLEWCWRCLTYWKFVKIMN
jgi:uncharacterized protein